MLASPYPKNSNPFLPPSMASPVNTRLDDLLVELNVLISERPDDERRTTNTQHVPEWARKDLSTILGCLDCK